MDKLKLFPLLAFCCIATFSKAQTDSKTAKKIGNEWHAAGDAIPRSKAFADALDSTLNLGADKKTKVFQAYLANTKSVDEIKLGAQSEDEKKTRLAANRLEFNTTMKAILPPDKYAQYEKMPDRKAWGN